MTIGQPIFGLSGVFYIISAISMPIYEIKETVRGKSSWKRWHLVIQQLVIAASVVAIWLAFYSFISLS